MLDIPRQQAHRSSSLASALNCALDTSLELTGAPFGNVQLMVMRMGDDLDFCLDVEPEESEIPPGR